MSVPLAAEGFIVIAIPPSSGTAFVLRARQTLTVVDPCGEQVADLVAFSLDDIREVVSSGRTFDYASKTRLTTGDIIYSNRSNQMLTIASDTVGTHDFMLTPCSADTFRILYPPGNAPQRGCFENLAEALAPYGVTPDNIPVAFNIFMNVKIDDAGAITVCAPISRAGDRITLVAGMDLIIGLTACSAPMSNNNRLKLIQYMISPENI